MSSDEELCTNLIQQNLVNTSDNTGDYDDDDTAWILSPVTFLMLIHLH